MQHILLSDSLLLTNFYSQRFYFTIYEEYFNSVWFIFVIYLAREVHPIFKQRLHIPHYKAFKIVWFTHLHVHLKEIDKPIHKKTSFILSVIWVRNVVFEVSVRKIAILRPSYCLNNFSVVNLISNKFKNRSNLYVILLPLLFCRNFTVFRIMTTYSPPFRFWQH